MSAVSAQMLVLAKQPLPGRVKTRLCPPCTYEEAAQVAAAALADTLQAVADTPAADRVLAFDGRPPAVPGFRTVPQRGDGLGPRIANAFADLDPKQSVLQIGMDTPQVNADLLTGCAERLLGSGVDAVLGLAEDGGWWALGLRDPSHAARVASVPMSTSDTGRATLATLRRVGLTTALLPALRDVDTFADALAVADQVPDGRFGRVVREVADRMAPAVVR